MARKGSNETRAARFTFGFAASFVRPTLALMLKRTWVGLGSIKPGSIIVSNHGGRVLGQTPASAEVLAEIADAVGGSMKIFVDGGIRTGTDVFKALALGADAVLIGRPFVPMVYGDGAQGVATYIEKIGSELRDTMAMCGVHTLGEITRDCVRVM